MPVTLKCPKIKIRELSASSVSERRVIRPEKPVTSKCDWKTKGPMKKCELSRQGMSTLTDGLLNSRPIRRTDCTRFFFRFFTAINRAPLSLWTGFYIAGP